MKVFLVFAAALLAAGCFVFAPSAPQWVQVGDEQAAQLCAGVYVPGGVCNMDMADTKSTWCGGADGCYFERYLDGPDEDKLQWTSDKSCNPAVGGCFDMPDALQECDI